MYDIYKIKDSPLYLYTVQEYNKLTKEEKLSYFLASRPSLQNLTCFNERQKMVLDMTGMSYTLQEMAKVMGFNSRSSLLPIIKSIKKTIIDNL